MTSPLNLVVFLFLVLTVSVLGEQSRLLCPIHCKCTYSGYTQGVARCTVLDMSLQQFSKDIKQVIVKDSVSRMNITPSMFVKMGLDHLFTVKIVNSSLSNLNVDSFKDLQELTNVDLSSNNLMLIHPDTFKNNNALRCLSLSGNPLQLTQVLPSVGHYVLKSDSLQELDLSKCQLNQLSPDAFSELKNLDYLKLSGNKLNHINPRAFLGLNQLEDLDLSHNEITYLPPDTFMYIEELSGLSLRGNPLKTFDMPNLSELKELDLSQCKFKRLTELTFEGTPEVSTLNISHNAIEKIDNDTFSALTSLRYLDLSHNNLKAPLSSFLFQENLNLETLSLSGNKELKSLPEFYGEFSGLYLYDISHCGLVDLNSKMFHGMHYIATLNISGNNIHKIDLKTFSRLTQLNVLDLSNNRLTFLDHNIFASNSEMTKLYLSDNMFHLFSAAVFRPLPKLYILDISHNRLTNLWNRSEIGIMKSEKILGEITHLNIAYNSLKHLHISDFASLMKLQILNLEGNPFVCNQHFIHMIEWLANNRVTPNAAKSTHPVNLITSNHYSTIDDRIENNKRWASTFDSFCPKESFEDVYYPTPTPYQTVKPTFIDDFLKGELQRHKMDLRPPFEKLTMNTSPPKIDLPPTTPEIIIDELRYEEYQYHGTDETTWTIIWVFKACAIFVTIVFFNIIGFQYWRTRTNYSLVGYKSSFHGGPSLPRGVNIPTRKGQRNAYQKLYEECSEPNPIVKNNKTLSIISVFSSNPSCPIQDV